jgi:hypothetical protein
VGDVYVVVYWSFQFLIKSIQTKAQIDRWAFALLGKKNGVSDQFRTGEMAVTPGIT